MAKADVATALARLAASPRSPQWVRTAVASLPAQARETPDPEMVADASRPYLWLLDRVGAEGLPLTQAGLVRPVDVSAAMTELGWDQWWIGKGNRENQTHIVKELRETAMALKLVRRLKGRLVRTPAGRRLAGDPGGVWQHIAARLPIDKREDEVVAATAALLWASTTTEPATVRNEPVTRAVGGLYMHMNGNPLESYEVAGMWRDTSSVLGILSGGRWKRDPVVVRAMARAVLVAGEQAPDAPAKKPTRPRSVPCTTLKVTLRGVKPPVWRRVRVPSNIRLDQLADVLLAAMGWSNYHLWAFRTGRTEYLLPNPEWPDDTQDARRSRLRTMLPVVGARARLDYDFGDGWEHDLIVEAIGTAPAQPSVLAGRNNCPPEDVGGPWGYREFLEALGDPDHEQHHDMLTWIGGSFDLAGFDLAEADAVVRTVAP